MSYCTKCGAPMPDGSQFCQSCGARADGSIRCSKCGSDKIIVQIAEHKLKITWPTCLALAGLGLFFVGVIGFVVGGVIGLVVGSIISSVAPSQYTAMVCQNCGHTEPIPRRK